MGLQGRVPAGVAERLQPGLVVEWWGRRAFYEVVEEFSMAIWRLVIIWSFAYQLARAFESDRAYYIAAVISIVWPLRFGIMEFLRWLNEVYVVCRDEDRGDGALYKFSGVFAKRGMSDPITNKSPSVSYSTPGRYRLWGWLTGEHMERVKVFSDTNMYIDGNRVPPELDMSIKRVRGTSPRPNAEDFPTMYIAQRMVNDALGRGLIRRDDAVDYTRKILWSVIYGED